MKTFLRFLAISAASLMMLSCSMKLNFDAEGISVPTVLYAGEQVVPRDMWTEDWDCSFQMWMWLYTDGRCLVHSGFPYYIEGRYVEEWLTYKLDGDVLETWDAQTGEKKYVGIDNHDGTFAVTWTHSSGTLWDRYSYKFGWVKSMTLYLQATDEILGDRK